MKKTLSKRKRFNIDISRIIKRRNNGRKDKKGETKKVYKFNDGFGNDIIYEFTKVHGNQTFAINWFLKYILISPPDEIQKYVLELQKYKNNDRLIKSKEIFERIE